MKTADEFFESKNGGKPASEMVQDGMFITATWAVALMKDYSDEQNKELREKLQEAKTSDGRGWKAAERLQRGNDALRNQLDDLNDELTRLRELLERCHKFINEYKEECAGHGFDILMPDIEKELNQK